MDFLNNLIKNNTTKILWNKFIETFRLISLNHCHLEHKNKITADSFKEKLLTQQVELDFVIKTHTIIHDVWIGTRKTGMFIKALLNTKFFELSPFPHPIPISPNPAQI